MIQCGFFVGHSRYLFFNFHMKIWRTLTTLISYSETNMLMTEVENFASFSIPPYT